MPYGSEGVGYARTDTSEAAAKHIVSKSQHLRVQVLAYLKTVKTPQTSDEIADALGKDFISVRPRLTELRNAGQIEDSGVRRKGRYGRPTIAWKVRQ